MFFVTYENGTYVPMMLADVKHQWTKAAVDDQPADQWGRKADQSIIEFEAYGRNYLDLPKTKPEFNEGIEQIAKVGNVYSNPDWLNDPAAAASSIGLDPSKMLKFK